MIGLDTNVLVRYIAQDDPRQSAQADALMEVLTPEQPGFVTAVALVESLWVMEDVYAAGRTRLVENERASMGLRLSRAPIGAVYGDSGLFVAVSARRAKGNGAPKRPVTVDRLASFFRTHRPIDMDDGTQPPPGAKRVEIEISKESAEAVQMIVVAVQPALEAIADKVIAAKKVGQDHMLEMRKLDGEQQLETKRLDAEQQRQLEQARRDHELRMVQRALIFQALIVASIVIGGGYAAMTGQWAIAEKVLFGLLGLGFGARLAR